MKGASRLPEVILRHVYFDEAGLANPKHEPFTVVAGVMLHVDDQYNPIQKYLLGMADDLVGPSRERPIDFVFHAKDLWHGSGFFPRNKWTLSKRLEILGHLADIPGKFDLPIIYSCVERQQYLPKKHAARTSQKINRRALAKSNRKCHLVCFAGCLSQTERWMREKHGNERVFVVVEHHQDHRDYLLLLSQFFANPRARSTIENDPAIKWPALTHVVEEPLFVRKSGSSPIQVADICAFVLARSLAGANHSEQLLKRIKPNLVSGFRRKFFVNASLGESS